MTTFLGTVVQYLDWIATILTFLALIIGFLVKVTKSEKLRKFAERLNFFHSKLEILVKQAEEFINFKGSDKKEWVLTKMNQLCIDNGISFDKQIASDLVEDIIETTKKVNKREKDVGQKEMILE
jgi:hypothetical protein